MNRNQVYFLVLILAFISVLGCDDDIPEKTGKFEVTSWGKGMDCPLILIDFKEEDLERLEDITGTHGWLRYHAYNLDEEFNQPGKPFLITIRETGVDEIFACTFRGPSYPWITVIEAEWKDK